MAYIPPQASYLGEIEPMLGAPVLAAPAGAIVFAAGVIVGYVVGKVLDKVLECW